MMMMFTKQPNAEGSSRAARDGAEVFDPVESWGPPMGLPAPLNDDKSSSSQGKKRESRGAAAPASRSFLSAKTGETAATRTSTSGAAARDLSGGRNGRTQAGSKPAGRQTERHPPAAAAARKPAPTDAKKVAAII